MTLLVHITTEAIARKVRSRGIKADRRRRQPGVFAMPVLPSFYTSHQWVRELRRRSSAELVAVDFRIPDIEPVLVGHYNVAKVEMKSAEAAGLIMHAEDPRGYEILVPRDIAAREIRKVRAVPQVVGWRYQPDAHGRVPCPCPVCCAGFGAADIRRRLDRPLVRVRVAGASTLENGMLSITGVLAQGVPSVGQSLFLSPSGRAKLSDDDVQEMAELQVRGLEGKPRQGKSLTLLCQTNLAAEDVPRGALLLQ